MSKPKLHIDNDVARKLLLKALVERGHDVTRTPCDWMPVDASDETQFARASARGRIILTANIRDFSQIAKQEPDHAGLLLINQRSWSLSALIQALDRALSETEAEDWVGQTRWLNDWRK